MTTDHISSKTYINSDTLEPYYITIPQKYAGMRIDAVLSDIIPELSRSRITNWLKKSYIQINGQDIKPKTKVSGGEEVFIIPTLSDEELAFTPEDIDIDIIYEDSDIIVINKPAGLTIHPGNGNLNKTLLNGLLYKFEELKYIPRAGIVHRLDKDTSGLLVVAKTLLAQTSLVRQLQERKVSRVYRAIVLGHTPENGTINKNIGRSPNNRIQMSTLDVGGKEAITHFRTLEYFDGFSYIECKLETGRTHQIRVHMKYIGHPIVGDSVYGSRKNNYPPNIVNAINDLNRQALHALTLEFIHPNTGQLISFKSELANDIKHLLHQLKTHNIVSHKNESIFEQTNDDDCEVLYVKY